MARSLPMHAHVAPALVVALLGSVALGVVSVLWPSAWLLLVSAACFGGVLIGSGAYRSFPLAVTLACAFAGVLIDAPLGPISAFGAFTIVLAGLIWLLWISRARGALPAPLGMLPLLSLVTWGFVAMGVRYHPTISGLQNVLAVAVFAGIALLTAAQARNQHDFVRWLDRTMLWAAASGVTLFLIGYAIPSGGPGFGLGPRGYAAFSCVMLAWCLARGRHGAHANLWMAALLVAGIALSLSRTALVVAMLLCLLAQLRQRKSVDWLRLGAVGAALGSVSYLGVTRVAAIHARFFEGDLALTVGGVPLNAEGRTRFWNATWDSFRQAPVFGHGPGSAQALIARLFPGNDQPHQDYLRILHDYGLIGFALWLTGYITLLVCTWRAWQHAPAAEHLRGATHLAAFLGLVAVALLMLTDNVVVYVFVMAPLGVLVGASLGIEQRVQDGVPERLVAAAPALTNPAAERIRW